VDGVEVHYPRYWYPPKVLRRHYGWWYWRSVRATVWRLLREGTPDAVLSYWAYPDGQVAAHVGRLVGAPSAVIVGGSDVLLLPRLHRGRGRAVAALQAADAVLAVSQDLAEKTAALGVPPEKVHVWRQGVDTSRFSPGDRGEARRRLGVPADRRVLLWVGRMHPVKGLDVLLDACARLRARNTPFHLYLVGDGQVRGALEAQASGSGLGSAVTFVGEQTHERVPDWYRAADLTVLPSWSEGLPNTLRESLACGTPFVASRVGGIHEIADGPRNRLVPPGEPAALADAIDQGLRERHGFGTAGPSAQGWEESARSLVGILAPLVKASQDVDRPWWGGRAPAPVKAAAPGRPPGVRQLLRRGLAAVLPRRLFLTHGREATRSVCLTFDDGPHPVHTPRLLDLLKSEGVVATFFVVGRLAERNPELVRRMADEGHAVGNHSFLHADASLLSAREAVREAARTQEVLAGILGQAPALYRPPRGKVGARTLLGLWRAGLTVVLWNVDPRDYACGSAAALRAWFRDRPPRGGDVVLLHDRFPHAVEALPELIRAARGRGLSFSRVSDWLKQ
jgi:peptidoglycan/xylan/chitin deacetylase (PgdA/CDA1 family)/glycosyltransferase involved in cell wall biosynthesis